MALKTRKPRRRASITSLIDVIFLLLLFFMLSSTFTQFSEVEIAASEAGKGSAARPTKRTSTLEILEKAVALDAATMSDDTLVSALTALKNSGTTSLSITPGEGVTTQRMIDVLGITAQVAGLSVRVEEPAR